MLVLPTNIERKWSGFSVSGQPTHCIETFSVRAAVVINDGLTEVIAVTQGSAGNLGGASIHGIEARAEICSAIETAMKAPRMS